MFFDISIITLATVLGTLIISLSIHEAMHAFTAHYLGDSTAHDEGRLTLNPLKHIDFLTTILLPFVLILLQMPPILAAKPVPFNPYNIRFGEYGAAMVALAGPLTNLLLAVVAAGVLHMFNVATGTVGFQVIATFIQLNIGLFVFNMIPFPPLDGSRLLYAFAPDPVRRVMEQIESLGLMIFLLVLFVGYQFISPVISSIIMSIYNFLV